MVEQKTKRGLTLIRFIGSPSKIFPPLLLHHQPSGLCVFLYCPVRTHTTKEVEGAKSNQNLLKCTTLHVSYSLENIIIIIVV